MYIPVENMWQPRRLSNVENFYDEAINSTPYTHAVLDNSYDIRASL